MPSTKTWIWIIVGFIGTCLVGLMALAGASVYFVGKHVRVETLSPMNSLKSFETARARFKDQRPLLEVDALGHLQQTRPIADLPTSPTKPTEMAIMVWDENKEHLVHLYMPFWLLRFGHNHIDLGNGDRRFDFDRLNISIADLERVGPVLLIDARGSSGERVLIWTQ